MWWSHDHLIFIMGISIPGKTLWWESSYLERLSYLYNGNPHTWKDDLSNWKTQVSHTTTTYMHYSLCFILHLKCIIIIFIHETILKYQEWWNMIWSNNYSASILPEQLSWEDTNCLHLAVALFAGSHIANMGASLAIISRAFITSLVIISISIITSLEIRSRAITSLEIIYVAIIT